MVRGWKWQWLGVEVAIVERSVVTGWKLYISGKLSLTGIALKEF